ncbi:MAG: hypothetical protein INR71_04165 [Terriglobus roseus]|nr:hypothetical protein [Terriglobus roseus]
MMSQFQTLINEREEARRNYEQLKAEIGSINSATQAESSKDAAGVHDQGSQAVGASIAPAAEARRAVDAHESISTPGPDPGTGPSVPPTLVAAAAPAAPAAPAGAPASQSTPASLPVPAPAPALASPTPSPSQASTTASASRAARPQKRTATAQPRTLTPHGTRAKQDDPHDATDRHASCAAFLSALYTIATIPCLPCTMLSRTHHRAADRPPAPELPAQPGPQSPSRPVELEAMAGYGQWPMLQGGQYEHYAVSQYERPVDLDSAPLPSELSAYGPEVAFELAGTRATHHLPDAAPLGELIGTDVVMPER